jgi:hypothetical protein
MVRFIVDPLALINRLLNVIVIREVWKVKSSHGGVVCQQGTNCVSQRRLVGAAHSVHDPYQILVTESVISVVAGQLAFWREKDEDPPRIREVAPDRPAIAAQLIGVLRRTDLVLDSTDQVIRRIVDQNIDILPLPPHAGVVQVRGIDLSDLCLLACTLILGCHEPSTVSPDPGGSA